MSFTPDLVTTPVDALVAIRDKIRFASTFEFVNDSDKAGLITYLAVATLASPAFTGNPTATTQALGNNSTRLATTAFVTAAFLNFTTDDLVVPYLGQANFATDDTMSGVLNSIDGALSGRVPTTRTVTAAGLATGGGALSGNLTVNVPLPSQATAEAGSDNTTAMTPLRTKQAIAAQASTFNPAAPGPIGGTTPSTIRATNLEITGGLGVGIANTTAGTIQGGTGIVAGTYPGIAGYVSLNGTANYWSEDGIRSVVNASFNISGFHGVDLVKAGGSHLMARFGTNGSDDIVLSPPSGSKLLVTLAGGVSAVFRGGSIQAANNDYPALELTNAAGDITANFVGVTGDHGYFNDALAGDLAILNQATGSRILLGVRELDDSVVRISAAGLEIAHGGLTLGGVTVSGWAAFAFDLSMIGSVGPLAKAYFEFAATGVKRGTPLAFAQTDPQEFPIQLEIVVDRDDAVHIYANNQDASNSHIAIGTLCVFAFISA